MATKTIDKKNRIVKVSKKYTQNHFYERLLVDWKDSVGEDKCSYTIKRALVNLQKYPMQINGYTDLKKIAGNSYV